MVGAILFPQSTRGAISFTFFSKQPTLQWCTKKYK